MSISKPEYYSVRFTTITATAAFVAALSRFLNYPQGNKFRTLPSSIEIWQHATPTTETVELYLSEEAFNATRGAFGQPPFVEKLPRKLVFDDCHLIFGGSQTPSWGLDEAQSHLMKCQTTPNKACT